MARHLTEEEQQEYLDGNWGKCPCCKDDDIEGGSIEVEGKTCHQRVRCLNCGYEWDDIYTLTSIEERI